MLLVLFFLIIIAGYAFLERYFKAHHAKVTWYDRLVGGVAGVLLLAGIWWILEARGDMDPPGSYVFITITMLPAIGLGVAALQAITRRK